MLTMADYFYVKAEWRIMEGKERLKGLLAHVNKKEKAKVMEKQIAVVGGSRRIYELVDANLKKGLIQCSLWKETLMLYRWRKNYCKNKLLNHKSWFSNAGQLNTLSYQSTVNFEQVVDVCCSQMLKPGPQLEPYYWGSCPELLWKNMTKRTIQLSELFYLGISSVELAEENVAKRLRIENLDQLFHEGFSASIWDMLLLGKRLLSDTSLRYGDVAKTLFEVHANSPPKLEELAMKAVRKEGRIALEHLSRAVQENDDYAFFDPDNFVHNLKALSAVGRYRLRQLKALHDGNLGDKTDEERFPNHRYEIGSITLHRFKHL